MAPVATPGVTKTIRVPLRDIERFDELLPKEKFTEHALAALRNYLDELAARRGVVREVAGDFPPPRSNPATKPLRHKKTA